MLRRNNNYFENIDDLSGLSKNHPILSLSLLIILFSLAGIPPMAGFFAKFYVFMAVIEQSMYFLAIVGLLSTVIAAFYYLRIIKTVYFEERENLLASYTNNNILLSMNVILLLVLGLFPFLIFNLTSYIISLLSVIPI